MDCEIHLDSHVDRMILRKEYGLRVLGMDLGSRSVKLVLMEQYTILHQQSVSTMSFYRDFCYYDKKLVVDVKRLGLESIELAISTGYGRNNTDIQEFTAINEVKAHVYGAIYQTGWKDFILLDIGGQDVKIAKVEKGVMTDLELNDKCAASCGRYLENMANVLEITLEELSNYYENPVSLNATCAVFSESELIGKIAEGIPLNRLCSGINFSLYHRMQPLFSKFRGDRLVVTGGVANNQALLRYLKKDYSQVYPVSEAAFNGAIGCCYYGNEFYKGREKYVSN